MTVSCANGQIIQCLFPSLQAWDNFNTKSIWCNCSWRRNHCCYMGIQYGFFWSSLKESRYIGLEKSDPEKNREYTHFSDTFSYSAQSNTDSKWPSSNYLYNSKGLSTPSVATSRKESMISSPSRLEKHLFFVVSLWWLYDQNVAFVSFKSWHKWPLRPWECQTS